MVSSILINGVRRNIIEVEHTRLGWAKVYVDSPTYNGKAACHNIPRIVLEHGGIFKTGGNKYEVAA